jgi:DNA-binding transcriptional LysR family regulator
MMDMLEAVTLDQLRTFIAAVDEGSFSAAGRKLRRAQSGVSQTLANLEAQLGVMLFDRSARYPRLTEEGRSLLANARSVADNVDEFKARARAMREGLEPELSVAMDVMYPMEALTRAAAQSRKTYPHTRCACMWRSSAGSSNRSSIAVAASASSARSRGCRTSSNPNL